MSSSSMSARGSLKHPAASLWPPGHPRALEYEDQYGEDDGFHTAGEGDDAEIAHGLRVSHRNGSGGVTADDDSKGDDDAEGSEADLFLSEPEPLQLPESTHTLFFTQPFCSLSVGYATGVVVVSIMCLAMALVNNLEDRTEGNPLNVPVNVTTAVRVAQYLSIIIALLMEEEIPTGLHLLRMVPKSAFKARFPSKSYYKFVVAALLRIAMGYIFLVNVFIILAQANGVIDIFYDVLALQFIQQLDDIAFTLAKMDILGKRLNRACTAKLFQTEFEKQKFRRSLMASLVLKSVYFVNLGLFLYGMIQISLNQQNGYYQCNEITIDFGNDVWEDALVKTASGDFERKLLVFSTFNGVYVKTGTEAGRPVYTEMGKVDQSPFNQEFVVPAEVKYSSELGAWIFTHPNIRKSLSDESQWLLRSEETTEYDLLNVDGDWSIWLSRISLARLTYTCNKCRDRTDCNLNGECNDDGRCLCDKGFGDIFMGTHCEVRVKKECGTLMDENFNATWTLLIYDDEETGEATLLQEYNRPLYSHIFGLPNKTVWSPNNTEGDIDWLVYTGRRWIHVGFNPDEMNMSFPDIVAATWNYHAFWSSRFTFTDPGLLFLSDPTIGDIPVGVDWHMIGERGSQFGPFGALYPLQKDGQVGRGLFRCAGPLLAPPANATQNETSQSG